jgi:poly(beta-D-mannuronate) lyase
MMKSREFKLTHIIIGVSVLAVLALVAGIFSAYQADHQKPIIPDNIDTTDSVVTTGGDEASVAEKPDIVEETPPAQIPSISYPGDLIDLTRWKITIPLDNDGNGTADEIKFPAIKTYSSEYFRLNDAKNAVVFKAHAGGATTKNSKYPRSELREMNQNGSEAAWSSFKGTHTMTLSTSATHLPATKSEMVLAQIHDEEDDIVMVRLERNHLFVEADGKEIGDLETNYTLGTRFTVVIEASNGRIKISYNGVQKVDYEYSGTGNYFKAGCYTQSNTSKGDTPESYGEATLYSISVSHT